MTIETVAILYQPATEGRSCSICIYREENIATGLICKIHGLPTRPDRWCGQGNDGKRREWQLPDKVETQGELF